MSLLLLPAVPFLTACIDPNRGDADRMALCSLQFRSIGLQPSLIADYRNPK